MTPDAVPWLIGGASAPAFFAAGWIVGHLRGRRVLPRAPSAGDVEHAAAAFHDAWASWAAAMLRADEEGTANIGDGRRARWPGLIRASYAELEAEWKDKDRAWARYALGLGRRPQ